MDFISGNKNATLDEFILGRERSGKSEFIIVSLPNSERPLYTLWNSPRTKKKYVARKNAEKQDIEIKTIIPKGTGGKPAYVMLMIEEVSRINVSIEAKGMILSFITCLEWNTGRIINQRSKKPMTISMMAECLGIGKVKVKRILKELINTKVMRYDKKKKSYLMSRKFIKKGMDANET